MTRPDQFADPPESQADNGEFSRSRIGAGMCVARLDAKGHVIEANEEFIRLFGGSPVDICSRGFYELFSAGAARDQLRKEIPTLAHGRGARFTERILMAGPDGTQLVADVLGIAIRGTSDAIETIIVLMVSERLGDAESLLSDSKKILSEMDSRILEGVAAGLPSGRLATLLHISRGGVEYHITGLLRKLKVANRTAMVSRAYANGMLAIGVWPPRVTRDFVK